MKTTGVNGHIAEWNGSLGDDALNGVYQIVPMTRTPDTTDVVIVAVAKNTAQWASHIDMLNTVPAGQATGTHFTSVLDCGTSLWRSEQVVGGGEG